MYQSQCQVAPNPESQTSVVVSPRKLYGASDQGYIFLQVSACGFVCTTSYKTVSIQFFSCNTQLLFSVILNFQIFSARQQSVELKSAANTKWKVLKKVMLSVSITSNTEVGQESNLVFDY